MDRASTLQEQFEAASRRIDRSMNEMLAALEDEMAERDYEAREHAARARVDSLGLDDRW